YRRSDSAPPSPSDRSGTPGHRHRYNARCISTTYVVAWSGHRTSFRKESGMGFTPEEIDYIRSQPVGRVGTVGSDGQPDVAPNGIEYDGRHFYVGGGHQPERTRKFRN